MAENHLVQSVSGAEVEKPGPTTGRLQGSKRGVAI